MTRHVNAVDLRKPSMEGVFGKNFVIEKHFLRYRGVVFYSNMFTQ